MHFVLITKLSWQLVYTYNDSLNVCKMLINTAMFTLEHWLKIKIIKYLKPIKSHL